MPSAGVHYCAVPRCPVKLGSGQRYCVDHAPDTSKGWRPQAIRITGRALTRLREALLIRDGYTCQICKRLIALRESIRDHIIPLAEGEQDQNSNDACQLLCIDCHRLKSQDESRRGIARTTGG